jgi:rfaE bifunctional protein nucleotidyltransferase chain/domain
MTRSKILTRDGLRIWRQFERQRGHRVVWTNGCFDLLHAGHVTSLEAAKELGDRLIVGVNSDDSVRGNKGSDRPIIPEADRARLIAALACVDAVCIFDDATPTAILAEIQPDVHCKGDDYAPGRGKPIPEADTVTGYGGTIAFLPFVPGLSTTAIVDKLRKAA